MQKTTNLVEFISTIQSRTPMYIGGRTIIHLKAFIDGWFYGKEEEIDDSYLLDDFQEWIQKKYNIRSSHSWDRIIAFYSTDECKALENFFQLFDEFITNKKDTS